MHLITAEYSVPWNLLSLSFPASLSPYPSISLPPLLLSPSVNLMLSQVCQNSDWFCHKGWLAMKWRCVGLGAEERREGRAYLTRALSAGVHCPLVTVLVDDAVVQADTTVNLHGGHDELIVFSLRNSEGQDT